jgi:predicted nucleic acid-binding protein
MLVVSDASPLNVLVRTSLVGVLPALYKEVTIPSAVASEMSDPRAPSVIRAFIGVPPAWLVIRTPSKLLPLPGLDPGERAAISLARELPADLLLIDEKRGRRAAQDLHLPFVGTIGMLESAAARNLIDLTDALARIRQTDFSVSDEIIKLALERDAKRRQSGS